MLDFLPTGTNLILMSEAGGLLEGITVERRREYKGIRFSVAASEGRPARADITEGHLIGYFNKYVATCSTTGLPWDNLYDFLLVKDGPYEGLSLNDVKVAGPERDRSKPFPLADWIPQGASFHVQYPIVTHQSDVCNFFMTGDGPGFMPAGNPTLLSAEKLVALYCERFSIPNTRDPFSVIIWRNGEYEGLSLRASKRRMDDNLEARRRAALHLGPLTAAYDAAWSKAKAQVEVERKALAEELERKAASAAAAAAEEEAREAAGDASAAAAAEAEEERAALAPAPAPAKLSVASVAAQIKAKEASLLKELEELEGLQAAHQRIKILESQIAELKTELKIE